MSDPGGSILVVDDDGAIREALAEVLSSSGYKVTTASDGEDALRVLGTCAVPDLILLDLMMPVMNGWQFRARQTADPRLATIPVLVVSAGRAARQAAAVLGAVGCLGKPVGVDELLGAVSKYV